MLPAPPHPEENRRLAALAACHVLDTGPEPLFDDLTRLVANTCAVPIALVSLIDEQRQWFKSRVGLGACQTPRELAFCAHAILGNGLFVVEDAREDPRFADNPLVVGEPAIRFYAGMPILGSDGLPLGTICAIDRTPRRFDAVMADVLQFAARQVGALLELRRVHHSAEALRHERDDVAQRLDRLIELAQEGLFLVDLCTGKVEASRRAVDMLELPLRDGDAALRLADLRARIHPEEQRTVARVLLHQIRRGRPFEFELRLAARDGEFRWFRLRGTTERDAAARPIRLHLSIGDAHEYWLANERLQRVSRMLEASQALANVGGWELDLATEQLFWTRETYRIHEVAPGNHRPTLTAALAFLTPESRAEAQQAIEDTVRTGRAFSIDVRAVSAKGKQLWCRVTGAAVFQSGCAVRVVGALQDVTGQRRADEDLRRAKEAAEAANHAKSAFLAAMSHEIRTPMHTVLGYADMLRDSALDAQQLECVEVIASSGSGLLRLIDEILDFSKVESGKLRLERIEFDAREVVAGALRMLQGMAREKGLALLLSSVDGAPTRALGDPARVRQVAVNLIGNAVKFTAEGQVTVELAALDGEVLVRVRDTGIGIEAEKSEQLFGDFVQVDSSASRRFGGTGLGLAISRRLVEAMGGRIGVESTPGVGSTFWFTVPSAGSVVATTELPAVAVAAPKPPLRSDNDAFGRGKRVLVAEDNRLNLRLAVRVLEQFGFEVDVALDGEVATRLATERDYDVVLMDCLMPGVDGFDATRSIRTHERATGRHVPIIALTANAFAEDRRACLEAGMDDFVSKPFTREALRSALLRAMQVPV